MIMNPSPRILSGDTEKAVKKSATGHKDGLPGAGNAAGYIPALDGLRGVAVLLVVLFHIPNNLFRAGRLGVTMFFVLSGYLITGLLLREFEKTGKISLPRFYMRRVLRLMPALWALVAVTLVAVWLWRPYNFDGAFRAAGWTLLYLSNWVRALGGSVWPFTHTWSLAIEEQFYLLWPALLCLLVKRGGAQRVFQTALVLALVFWAWRTSFPENPWTRIENGLDTRLAEPLMGCALAAWLYQRQGKTMPKAMNIWALVAFCALLSAAYYRDVLRSYSTLVVVFSTMLIIADVVHNPHSWLKRLLCWPPLVQLGMVSYGLYLWHMSMPNLFLGWRQYTLLELQILKVLGGTFFALLSFYIVERPFLRMKKYFEARV